MKKRWIAVAAVAVLGVALAMVWSAAAKRIDDRLTSYDGVKLGASKAEVGYLRGKPTFVYGPWVKNRRAVYVVDPASFDSPFTARSLMPEGTSVNDYDDWSYRRAGRAFSGVSFSEDRVISFECSVTDEKAAKECPPMMGVRIGDTEAQVARRLGHPVETELHDDFTKSAEYESGHLIGFAKGKVTQMAFVDMGTMTADRPELTLRSLLP